MERVMRGMWLRFGEGTHRFEGRVTSISRTMGMVGITPLGARQSMMVSLAEAEAAVPGTTFEFLARCQDLIGSPR